MNKFKTVINDGKYVSAQGILRVLAEKDGWKQKVELWLLNDVTNNNNWRYERLEEHKHLFAETPILVAYVGRKIGDGHNFVEIPNPDGTLTASFMDATAERIVGFFKSDSDIRIEHKDGKKWIVGVGWIWQWYAQELVAKIKEQGLDGMSISIETLINEQHKDGTTEVFTKYQILGTTILGDDVDPAVTGANIRALSALGVDKIRETTLRVASKNQEKQTNPQTKTKKENKVTMKIKDLKDKFEGFRVLAVDGDKVALLSLDKGDAYVSTAVKDNGEIVEGVKTAANATVVFDAGESKISMALDTVLDTVNAQNAELQNKLNASNEKNEALQAELIKLQNAEKSRRTEAVKNAIKKRLADNKANDGCEIADDACDDLLTDERVAEFVEMTDKDGKWIGEQRACEIVDSRCMAKNREVSAMKANAQKRIITFNHVIDNGEQDTLDETEKAIRNILD